MLILQAVSYRYAGATRLSLREVSLTLGEGEVLGVVGRSEAGKSTLCLVASGLAPRTLGGTLRGRVLLDGADSSGRAMHEMARDVAIGFQNPGTQLSGVATTVYEEVAFGPMNLGISREQVLQRTESSLDALAIRALSERDPERLSGGQQQLVAIAGLLALAPRHLILDEPTAQLDPAGTRLVGEALRQLAASGTSLLIAEHKTDLLDGLCERIIAIDGGRVVLDGPTARVFDDPRLAGLGVEPPARARLTRALAARGLDVSVVASALAGAAR